MWQSVEAWIFDLDNTLYPAECNLFDQVSGRMGQYIADRLDLDPVSARALQKQYFRDFGTTLRGLMSEHGVDADDYLAYVHDIDFSAIVADPALASAMRALPGTRIIHTNASRDYALRVVDRLGLDGLFDDIFDIRDADFLPKPELAGYQTLIARNGIDPRRAVMVEDIARNLAPASALGMTTVWLPTASEWSHDGADENFIDHVIDDLGGWLAGTVAALRPNA
ncbi:MAG: pyrimidine 5'-nucleotidase [Sphingomonadales bacterium]